MGAALLALACGCVELRETITLNPDGRGKVVYDLVRPPGELMLFAASEDKKKKDSPDKKKDPIGKREAVDTMKQAAVAKLLEAKGVTAWKDVSAQFLPDGRLRLTGTAYFERLADLMAEKEGSTSSGPTSPVFRVTRPKKGELKVALRYEGDGAEHATGGGKKDPRYDVAKMTDKELNDYISAYRAVYQTAKPLYLAVLTDLKIETTLRLPGEVREVRGFKRDGDRAVSRVFVGRSALEELNAVMAQDDAALRKKVRKAGTLDVLEEVIGLHRALGDAEVTVHRLGGPQFDYDKEVREARAAYPALRKRLKLKPETKLPGESGRERRR